MFREQNQPQTLLQSSDIDLKYNLCQQFITINKSRDNILQEAYLIYQQNQVLTSIKNQMEAAKLNKLLNAAPDTQEENTLQSSTITYRPERASFKRLPINRTSRGLNSSHNESFEAPQSKIEFEIDAVLKEVQEKCSQQAVTQIIQLIKKTNQMSNQLANHSKLAEQLERCKKQVKELKLRQGQLERKLLQTDKKMKQMSTSFSSTSQFAKKQTQRILMKQKYISQHQTALVLNEKRINESMKRLTAKESSVKKQREELEDERKLVDEIWDNIIEKVSGGGDNFRSDVYMKCKESLKKQREVLKKEEEELDRQHENMSKIISQIETSGG